MNDEATQPVRKVDRDVHVGKDGWLFLVGGNNSVLDLFRPQGAFDDKKRDVWTDLLKRREARARGLGIDYLHVVVPEKLTLYSDMCGIEGIDFAHSALLRHYEHATISGVENLVDCMTPMLRQKRLRDLYYKTDTHWNFQGCLCVFLEICRMAGAIPAAHTLATAHSKVRLVLDLGSKLEVPIDEEFRVYNFARNAKRTFANDIVLYKEKAGKENDYGLHVGSQVIYKNTEANDTRRVVLFGDSFSEYRRHLLTGLLAETFQEVHFIWSTSIDWNYVEKNKPDLLITENAERYLTSAPDDSLSIEAYTARKMQNVLGAA